MIRALITIAMMVVFISSAQAQAVPPNCGNNVPPSECVISSATVVNVYLDPTWDQDVEADGYVPNNASGLSEIPSQSPPTQEFVDAYVQALLVSSYLSGPTGLGQQYLGTPTPASWGGSVQCKSSTTLHDLLSGLLSSGASSISNSLDPILLKCLPGAQPAQALPATQTFYNFLVQPASTDADPNGDCAQLLALYPDFWRGFHFMGPHGLYALIPVGCAGGRAAVEIALSHQLVEGLTEPNLTTGPGWFGPVLTSTGTVEKTNGGLTVNAGLADMCENLITNQALPPGAAAFVSIGNNNIYVSEYSSNSNYNSLNPKAACTWFPTPSQNPPTITSMSVCGSGQSTQITLNGTFPAATLNVAPTAFGGPGMYIVVTVTPPGGGQSWSAGSDWLDPDSPLPMPTTNEIQLGTVTVNSSQVVISGFGSNYDTSPSRGGVARTVPTGSMIQAWVVDPSSGSTASSQSVPASQPNTIWSQSNGSCVCSIPGQVMDNAGQCIVFKNACGGTSALDGAPGEPCGQSCGQLSCNGPNALSCKTYTNVCGGCSPVQQARGKGPQPGQTCSCSNGTGNFYCTAKGQLACGCP